MQTSESQPWLRMLQIVLGGICILLSLVILAYIGPAILTIILILSVILLIVGIERMAVGIAMPTSPKGSRYANIGIGLLVIAFSLVLMQFPVFTSAVLVVLAAIALLINGIARIIQGISFKSSGSSRDFSYRRRRSQCCSIYFSNSTANILRVGSIRYYDFYRISN